MKINQDNKEWEDHENDPTFTPDTLPTYVQRARDVSFSALDTVCIKMNVMVKGKGLLWAYESYYRPTALKDKLYRDCVSYWIQLIMDDVKIQICCNLVKNMWDFSKISPWNFSCLYNSNRN